MVPYVDLECIYVFRLIKTETLPIDLSTPINLYKLYKLSFSFKLSFRRNSLDKYEHDKNIPG